MKKSIWIYKVRSHLTILIVFYNDKKGFMCDGQGVGQEGNKKQILLSLI